MTLCKFSDSEKSLNGAEDNKRIPDAFDVVTKCKSEDVSAGKPDDPLGNERVIERRHRVTSASEAAATDLGNTQKGFGEDHHDQKECADPNNVAVLGKNAHERVGKKEEGEANGRHSNDRED